MANYPIPENPEYLTEIRALEDSDPARATTIFNPLFEVIINNIHYTKLAGENLIITAALTNTQEYPFNNSRQTISLPEAKASTGYRITAEVESFSGGSVGDILITDKALNGFKVEYTGSATSANIKLYIDGGQA